MARGQRSGSNCGPESTEEEDLTCPGPTDRGRQKGPGPAVTVKGLGKEVMDASWVWKAEEDGGRAGTQLPLEGFASLPSDRKLWGLCSCEVQNNALEGPLASIKGLCDFTHLLVEKARASFRKLWAGLRLLQLSLSCFYPKTFVLLLCCSHSAFVNFFSCGYFVSENPLFTWMEKMSSLVSCAVFLSAPVPCAWSKIQ